ncbi:MAG: hypothetical protein IKE65_03340 [Clostridia bacterium]|nr:hypothetical protein [Clostridia bacterium]
MPTFKAGFAHYEAQKGEKENLENLIEQYNDLVQRLTFTVNHLDEENLHTTVLEQLTHRQEGDGE